ncbi:MAG: hypothetical protein HKN85_00760, partial [Gammaproteobacteria bacterium]|nr:hypothetical protein [Gammaproteobacteria bacterium]
MQLTIRNRTVLRFAGKIIFTGVAAAMLSGCLNEQRLEQSRLDDFARFGRSIDVSGFDAAVGAYLESNGNSEGAVYVFRRHAGAWSISARLESPSPGDEQFGDSVAMDGAMLAVGAPLDHQPGAFRSGSVYVFRRTGPAWNHIQTLSSPAPQQAWEAFGTAVALDGDHLIVGAPDRDQGGIVDAGAAFVYHWNGAAFVLTDALAVPAPGQSDKFGARVEVEEDTAAVSALRRDTRAGEDAGAVYVYHQEPAGFSLSQTLTASDGSEDDLFGSGIALFEQNDGARRLVVGAEGKSVGGADSAGAAYVFDAPPAGVFSETVKLLASDGAAGDIFGTDVEVEGNIIIVGAGGEDNLEIDAGAAYAYILSGGIWNEEAKLTNSTADMQSFLGSAVGLGLGHAFAGATGEEIGPLLSDTGTVQVFARPAQGPWEFHQALSAAGTETGDSYGRGLVIDADRIIASARTRT